MTLPLTRRFLLRNATRTAHDALDAMIGGFDTVETYRRYLAGTARFRLPVEAGLNAISMPVALGDWRPTFVAAQIRRDLERFELAPSAESAAPLHTETDSALYGILYVLEGSGLGARLLARRAAELGLGEETGAAHLFAQAGNNHAWQAFVVALERAESFDEELAVAAANDMFRRAECAFAFERP